MGADLVEISQAAAERLIAGFRVLWDDGGLTAAAGRRRRGFSRPGGRVPGRLSWVDCRRAAGERVAVAQLRLPGPQPGLLEELADQRALLLAELLEMLTECLVPDRLGGQVKVLDLLDLLLRVRARRLGVPGPVGAVLAVWLEARPLSWLGFGAGCQTEKGSGRGPRRAGRAVPACGPNRAGLDLTGRFRGRGLTRRRLGRGNGLGGRAPVARGLAAAAGVPGAGSVLAGFAAGTGVPGRACAAGRGWPGPASRGLAAAAGVPGRGSVSRGLAAGTGWPGPADAGLGRGGGRTRARPGLAVLRCGDGLARAAARPGERAYSGAVPRRASRCRGSRAAGTCRRPPARRPRELRGGVVRTT